MDVYYSVLPFLLSFFFSVCSDIINDLISVEKETSFPRMKFALEV